MKQNGREHRSSNIEVLYIKNSQMDNVITLGGAIKNGEFSILTTTATSGGGDIALNVSAYPLNPNSDTPNIMTPQQTSSPQSDDIPTLPRSPLSEVSKIYAIPLPKETEETYQENEDN